MRPFPGAELVDGLEMADGTTRNGVLCVQGTKMPVALVLALLANRGVDQEPTVGQIAKHHELDYDTVRECLRGLADWLKTQNWTCTKARLASAGKKEPQTCNTCGADCGGAGYQEASTCGEWKPLTRKVPLPGAVTEDIHALVGPTPEETEKPVPPFCPLRPEYKPRNCVECKYRGAAHGCIRWRTPSEQTADEIVGGQEASGEKTLAGRRAEMKEQQAAQAAGGFRCPKCRVTFLDTGFPQLPGSRGDGHPCAGWRVTCPECKHEWNCLNYPPTVEDRLCDLEKDVRQLLTLQEGQEIDERRNREKRCRTCDFGQDYTCNFLRISTKVTDRRGSDDGGYLTQDNGPPWDNCRFWKQQTRELLAGKVGT